jgi:hypothetical protein
MFPFTLILVIFGLAAAIFIIGYVMERKRAQKMKAVAEEMGLAFLARGDLQSLPRLHLFFQGHSKRIRNLMEGEANNVQAKIFDYRYTTGSGKNSHTANQTVIWFYSPVLLLPDFSLCPKSIFHRIVVLFGYHDINFDTHPVFSKKYWLRGQDELAIRGLFNETALAFYDDHTGLNTEGSGQHLVVFRANRRVSSDQIRSFLEQGFEVLGLFKAEVEQLANSRKRPG